MSSPSVFRKYRHDKIRTRSMARSPLSVSRKPSLRPKTKSSKKRKGRRHSIRGGAEETPIVYIIQSDQEQEGEGDRNPRLSELPYAMSPSYDQEDVEQEQEEEKGRPEIRREPYRKSRTELVYRGEPQTMWASMRRSGRKMKRFFRRSGHKLREMFGLTTDAIRGIYHTTLDEFEDGKEPKNLDEWTSSDSEDEEKFEKRCIFVSKKGLESARRRREQKLRTREKLYTKHTSVPRCAREKQGDQDQEEEEEDVTIEGGSREGKAWGRRRGKRKGSKKGKNSKKKSSSASKSKSFLLPSKTRSRSRVATGSIL